MNLSCYLINNIKLQQNKTNYVLSEAPVTIATLIKQ